MAYGFELVLQLTTEQVRDLVHPEHRDRDGAALIESVPARVHDDLAAAHEDLLRKRFGQGTRHTYPYPRYEVTTPAGTRDFTLWGLDHFGDEANIASVLGVSLLGRYYPRWLDWREARGGSGLPVTVSGPEVAEQLAQARTALAGVVPAFAHAPLVVTPQHY